MPAGIICEGLTADEADKVGRMAAAIRERFAPTAVAGCHAVGPGHARALCFTRASGQMNGCVAAHVFLAAPDDRAAGLITLWRH